ncbi:MAG TPA: tRNA (adenosine(37)-N6)-dimethylallyltransferase MiaA [Candidatus Limnocylindria bacterium]|nr:tRNA (adenosine(37)-N6)-dimethylallyltransferase MiaA [Candidatus Limnocylindria bacterium]
MPSWDRSLSDGALPPLIVVCGATATGKTGLSLALAEQLPGAEIVSADSRQVYRGMDIGTAKVSAADRQRVPHHCLDLVEPDQPFSAGEYRRHALQALAGIAERGGVALLVGGTGLYVRTVARNLPLEETATDPELRARLDARLAGEGLAVLSDELKRLAPTVAGSTDLANPRRVVRALERATLHGDRLPPAPAGYPGPSFWLGLTAAYGVHNRWIAARAAWQFDNGLLEEATEMRSRFDPDLPAFSAFGYREAFAVLDGTLTREAALAQTITRTRQFARRQGTWFRSEPDVTWLDAAADPLPAALAQVEAFLRPYDRVAARIRPT